MLTMHSLIIKLLIARKAEKMIVNCVQNNIKNSFRKAADEKLSI
jgi:hypothetical protein